jgi:hypothetical protein
VRRFTSVYVHTAHFGQHTDITLKDVPDREYTLTLYVEDTKRELERSEHRTWKPVQRQYVPYFPNTYTHQCICICMYRDVSLTSKIRVEVRMKIGHSIWAKYRDQEEVIDLQGLSNDYWNPEIHNFIVPSQSLSPTVHDIR